MLPTTHILYLACTLLMLGFGAVAISTRVSRQFQGLLLAFVGVALCSVGFSRSWANAFGQSVACVAICMSVLVWLLGREWAQRNRLDQEHRSYLGLSAEKTVCLSLAGFLALAWVTSDIYSFLPTRVHGFGGLTPQLMSPSTESRGWRLDKDRIRLVETPVRKEPISQ